MSQNLSNSTNLKNSINFINSYVSQVSEILKNLPTDQIEKVILRLEEARWKGQEVFTCGNGGSAATAIHFASDLQKGVMVAEKPSVDAESLCGNISLLTAWANDSSYQDIFAKILRPKVKEEDILIAISGSGKSQNVLKAVEVAREARATTIGFTGFDGGKLKDMVDICIIVPSNNMEQIEDVHLLLCHLIITYLREV